jgi:glyceraldehyde 3-phosphate dehydrogenase
MILFQERLGMKIAINGFGRIGRLFFLAAIEKGLLKNIVAINDTGNAENLAYLLKYDSVHGKRKEKIVAGENCIYVGWRKINFLSIREPENLPWKKLGVDIVVDCTGAFTKKEDAQKHINAGAKKVLISAPGKEVDFSVILGVNEKGLKKEHKIISMASCTSNCVVPLAKSLHDNFGIEKGYMVTTHAYTADQKIVDASHKDFRRGRTAAQNIVPTTTGAAKMIGEIIPELKGKLDGYALRVPVANGSIVNLTVFVNKVPADEKEVNKVFEKASKETKGILEYCTEPIVSSDIIHNSHSCIFDSEFTKVMGNMVNVVGWYDNEWGYSNRLVETCFLLKKIG